MACHISDTKLDAREVFGDDPDTICHPPVCECDGCKLPLAHDGYADGEQRAYYNGFPAQCRGYLNLCDCPTCNAREYRLTNGGKW